MLDAMAIRSHVDYNAYNESYSGYVNLGDGIQDVEAKEALVFMVVGLSGGWKAPVAYYLTKGLSSETQHQLVNHCISALHEKGFQVLAITMDGLSANVSMGYLFGANLEVTSTSLRTWFPSGRDIKTHIIFDVCHMIKLLRNTLQAYGSFHSPDGEICWHYLSTLQSVQEETGLRLANRITSRHLKFQRQKMKVCLATQLFSLSVAKSLRTMLEIGDRRFQGCLPTALFIERIDRLFDVLNSRFPQGRGYKSHINKVNLTEIQSFLIETEAYLLSIKMTDGQPLNSTRRSMCVKGFVVTIESILGLSQEILKHQKYLLCYRLSQDHLELFFNAIRRCGGWNNNPTAKTFESAFRRIMTHCGALKVSSFGNCSSLDKTTIVQAGTSTYLPPDSRQSDIDLDNVDQQDVEAQVLMDHCYDKQFLSLVTENIIVYLTGWIIRKILGTISCETCRQQLVEQAP